jgi:hypothetical protein
LLLFLLKQSTTPTPPPKPADQAQQSLTVNTYHQKEQSIDAIRHRPRHAVQLTPIDLNFDRQKAASLFRQSAKITVFVYH